MGKKIALFSLLMIVLALTLHSPVIVAQDDGAIWQAWENKDVSTLGDDNSGSTFAISNDVLSPAGNPTLQVTPSGSAEETKLAFPVSGADLQDWLIYGQIELEVYLSPDNTINPNRFFMGMADVGGQWTWVGGVISSTEAQPEWNRIVYVPDAAMHQPNPANSYMIYLSFFNADDAGAKTPLVEPIYLGSAYLTGEAPPVETPIETPSSDELLWAAWESKDVAALGDDNSGSTFAISEEVLSSAGNATVQVTPSGTAEETKLAFTVSGADLQEWVAYGQVELEVYLPEGNALNANSFFMGMADTTGEFAWVGGIFSETEAVAGWNRIVYLPDAAMRAPNAEATYTIFLSFFNANDEGAKTPLTEPFNLGSIYLTGAEAAVSDDGGDEEAPAATQWAAWDAKNPGMMGDDNTGTDFAQADDVMTPGGLAAMQILPTGSAEETKMAFPVSGANMQDWAHYSQLELEVYLPPDNSLNPNNLFMGVADITNEWTWVNGNWGEFQGDSEWVRVVVPLDPTLRQPDPTGAYFVYFAFMNTDENGNKTALSDPFYLGSIFLTGAGEVEVTTTPVPSEPLAESLTWAAWESKDVAALGDDNSGSSFAISEDVMTPSGVASVQVTPSGTAEETKLAFQVSGADLQDWLNYTQVELELYIPEGSTLPPNRFFMGMADTTGEFAWVGGIFSTSEAAPGWNRIVYAPDNAMRNPKADANYTVFLSFFNEDLEGKNPLTEPIYLGSAFLTAPISVAAPGEFSIESVYQREVDLLLGFDDVALLDAIGGETFDFFWSEANPNNGLIKDRSTPDSPSSIASVGFGLAGIPIAVDRGWISYDDGYERALVTLQTFANGGVQGDHGFFYHFVDMETGERVWSSELSSIDSTLFIAGALTAGAYFKDTEVDTLATQLYEAMDWEWMMSNDNMVVMGWKPDIGFLSNAWDHFDESLLLYVLAIGSPTYPVPADTWERWDRPVNLQGEFIYLGAEPLFVYQYPLAFVDLRGKEDAYANYFNNTTRACERNRQFSVDNADTYATYQNGVWGISASDGPRGYRAYGATGGNHDGTIAPYASIACLPFTPDTAFESMRAMLSQYGPKVWREYGFVSAINAQEDWFSVEHIGIDQGDILLMLSNYQDNFVWDLFTQIEAVQRGLEGMGFVDSQGDYAVTPAYLEQVKAD